MNILTKKKGFTLIEIVISIMLLGILFGTTLVSFHTMLKKSHSTYRRIEATQTAKKCMDWFLGQRYLNGFSSVPTGTTVPNFCTIPTGYTIATNVATTTISGDSNYKTITVTVGYPGLSNAVLTSLIADY